MIDSTSVSEAIDLGAMNLEHSELFKNSSYINGEWVSSDSCIQRDASSASDIEDVLSVENPATGKSIAKLKPCTEQQIKECVESAHKAFLLWRKLSVKKRSEYLIRWYQLIEKNKSDLAKILTLEQGKPLAEAEAEITYGANYVRWFAEQIKRQNGLLIPAPSEDKKILVTHEPVGVVAAITPWNFPMAMIARKAAPALASGCTFIVKPAKHTPLSALALAQLACEAGIPKGVFNVVVSMDTKAVGRVFTTEPLIKKITFTGSTAVGKTLVEQSASTLKKTTMELGGNAPFIVFDDADIDAAVEGCMAAKFRNAGQTCICINRVLVDESIAAHFTSKLKAAVEKLVIGSGLKENVDIGPLITPDDVPRVDTLIASAVEQGAIPTVTLEHQQQKRGQFYPPTVLEKVTPEMSIYHEEVFAPVVLLTPFKTESEAVNLANDTPFGLAGYFYSQNMKRCWRVAEALQVGMVGVNDTSLSNEVAPFGGVKESGFGREGSVLGLDDYVNIKYTLMGGLGE